MVISPALIKMMTETVTVYKFTGTRTSGEAIHDLANPSTYKCRINYKTRVIRDTMGVEKVSQADIVIGGVFGISPQDKIVLPSGSSPAILKVEAFSDEKGPHHEVVYV